MTLSNETVSIELSKRSTSSASPEGLVTWSDKSRPSVGNIGGVPERSEGEDRSVTIVTPPGMMERATTFTRDSDDLCGEDLVVTLTTQKRFRCEGTKSMQKLVEVIHEEGQH